MSSSCEICQGNGELVTDWERYLHPHKGDVGDEAVAECSACNGYGTLPIPAEVSTVAPHDGKATP